MSKNEQAIDDCRHQQKFISSVNRILNRDKLFQSQLDGMFRGLPAKGSVFANLPTGPANWKFQKTNRNDGPQGSTGRFLMNRVARSIIRINR